VTDAPPASRWLPVGAYAALSAANQMLWLTYTPITTDSARHYGVSEGAIGWLAELFPLLYVVLAVPAGRLIDAHLPRWLAAGAVLTALGALVRLDDTYGAVLAGQLLVAVAQPLVLNAVTAVPGAYLAEAARPTGVAAASAGIFGGMVLALVLGASLGTAHLGTLLGAQAAITVLAALVLCGSLAGSRRVVRAGGHAATLRSVWADRRIRLLVGLVCAGFGVFIALTTWLQTLLDPAGVSDTASGFLLLAMVLAGVVGSATLPPVLVRRGAQLRFVAVSVAGSVAALVLLAAAPGVATGVVAAVVIGALLLTDLPLILDLVERRAGAAEATASGLVWIAGNAAGVVASLVVQAVRHHAASSFLLLAALLLAAVPLLVVLTRAPAASDTSHL